MKPLQIFLDRRYIKVTTLAKAAGVPASSIYTYTSGTGNVWNMSVTVFIAIAHALGMTADELADELRRIEIEQLDYAFVDMDEADDGDDPAAGQD